MTMYPVLRTPVFTGMYGPGIYALFCFNCIQNNTDTLLGHQLRRASERPFGGEGARTLIMKEVVREVAGANCWGGEKNPPEQGTPHPPPISNIFEIEASQLALANQPDSKYEAVCRENDYRSSEAVGELTVKVKATLPKAVDSEHQKLLDELKGKSSKACNAARPC